MPIAHYTDGSVALVDNSFGKGRSRLVGTFPGITFMRTLDHEPELLIRDALRYAGVQPRIQCLDTAVKARLHKGPSGDFLWVLNTQYDRISTDVTLLPSSGDYTRAEDLVTGETFAVHDGVLSVTLNALGGTVVKLISSR
jgi:beta-galactosidase